MEVFGKKTDLLKIINNLPDDNYHLIIVKDKPYSLNQLYAILRKSKPHGISLEEWKIQVKDKLGLFYYEDDIKIYRSFKKLTTNEITHLINLM